MSMDIASLSTRLSEERLAQELGARVLSLALKTAKSGGDDLRTLLESVETASDPALGSRLDTSA